MPISLPTSPQLARVAADAARATVREKWRAVALSRGGPLSAAEITQMQEEMDEAFYQALFTFLVTNVVLVVAGASGTIT